MEAENEDQQELEDDSEVTLEKVEEDMYESFSADEEDEENVLHMDDLVDLTNNMVRCNNRHVEI